MLPHTTNRVRRVALALWCGFCPSLGSLSAQARDSLFQTEAPLQLRLATDLRALLRDRGEERQEHRARLRYATVGGDTGSMEVEVRTRGIFRLKHCAFPPLRLDFPKTRVAGTPFAGQDKVKLVTHCRESRSPYEQNVLREYALYRAFNAISDRSFRARLAQVTYVDTVQGDSVTRYAFLLEPDAELAQRLGAEVVEADNVHDATIDGESITFVAVFQYLIGNTDWSVWKRHNIAILRPGSTSLEQGSTTLLAIPYDFDFSGAVGAPYATVPPQLPIRSVRERLYRGFCQPDSVVVPVLARFRATRDSVYARLRAVPGLDPRELKDLVEYFDQFYRTLDDPRATRREFVVGCRRVPA